MNYYLKIPFSYLVNLFILLIHFGVMGQKSGRYQIRTLVFYNVENLFDTVNDSLKYDDRRTPEGKDRWTHKAYSKKIGQISQVIADIGSDITKTAPDLVGLAEIENQTVLEDLIASEALRIYNYGSIHFDSPDERGIDVALLFKKDRFTPIEFKIHPLIIKNKEGKRDYTRDQLLIFGVLDTTELYLLINHWPSRSGGATKSAYKREAAAQLNKKIIDSIQHFDPHARIISMGDFNDHPDNDSFKRVLKTSGVKDSLSTTGLYNPMEAMYKKGMGTLAHRDQWGLFDQIYFTANLLMPVKDSYHFWKSGIYMQPYLVTRSGKYKGYPWRSYENGNYTGGYSDHFPVYIYLVKPIY